MQYARLWGIEKEMSRLIYGTGNDILRGKDTGAAIECLDAAFECGFRAFDSAYTYECAEENLGIWMQKRGNREQVIIIDKGCNPGQMGFLEEMSPELIIQQCNESLERLQCEYCDCYNLHRDDETKPVGPIVEVLNQLKSEGKIGRFGGSNWKWQRIQEANEYAQKHGLEGFSLASPCYSLAVLEKDPWGGSVSISGSNHADARRYFYENQIPVFAYSSLARGFLSGKYKSNGTIPIEKCLWWGTIEEYDSPDNRERLKRAEEVAKKRACLVSQVCLAWLLNQNLDVFPIVGPASVTHLLENAAAVDMQLTKEEIEYLDLSTNI